MGLCAENNQTTEKQIHIFKITEFSCCIVTVGGTRGQQLNVLQVEKTPIDMNPKGFLFD